MRVRSNGDWSILESWADAHVEDRVRIFEQNAAQILGIVKKTFPRRAFDIHSTPQCVLEPSGDGETLEDLWYAAEIASDVRSQSTPVEVLEVLTKVSSLTPNLQISSLTGCSSRKAPKKS